MQTKLYETLVDKHREEILAAEDYIWRHPETGFREWKTTAYMQDVFEKAGYTLVKGGISPASTRISRPDGPARSCSSWRSWMR